jgi:hypothetical protein
MEAVVDKFEALPNYLAGGTEKSHKPLSVSQTISEAETQ